jgi:hypothetical protein
VKGYLGDLILAVDPSMGGGGRLRRVLAAAR